MRHIRLPGQNLSTFKNQIGGFLRKLNKFDSTEKNEALTYIRRYIDPEAGPSSRKRVKYRKYPKPNTISKSKFIYTCQKCKHTEKNMRNLLRHLETHVGTPISCQKCKKTFNSQFSYKWHLKHYCKIKKLGKTKKFKCSQCVQEFFSKRTLESHLQGHKRNNCTYCDKVLTRRVQLIRHLLEVHSIKLERDMHFCQHCEKRYIKKSSLYYHYSQHFPDKNVCMECGQMFDNSDRFQEHKLSHDNLKRFKCQKCGEKFSRRQQYLFHLMRHNQYKCLSCNESFASRAKVTVHKKQGHQVEGLNARFLCPHCPLAFHREGKFLLHLRKHTDDFRSINCKYCKKRFSSPYAYYKHCITINHEKYSPEIINIACNKCDKKFLKRHDLRQHMYRVHNERKQFLTCQHCNYKTIHKANLERHISLHFRVENSFTCEYCGKSCDSSSGLKDHIAYNHIQEKRFNCGQCDKSFKRNSELIRHKDSHSNERPHVCRICEKSYKRLTHLKRHEKTAHQIANQTRKIQKVEESRNDIFLNFNEGSDASNSGNIIEQITCPFVPDKGRAIDNEELYKVYNDFALSYGNTSL